MPPTEQQPPMEHTDFGWAVVSDEVPHRGDGHVWLKTPERHVYILDGDGWYRAQPPEQAFLPARHLPHP